METQLRLRHRPRLLAGLAAAALVLWAGATPVRAQDAEGTREVVVAFEYPGVEVTQGESFSVGLLFQNRGSRDESLQFALVDKPQGWTTAVKSGDLAVTGVYLPAGQSRTLSFQAVPPASPRAGTYDFRLRARSPDGVLSTEQVLAAVVRARPQLGSGGSAAIGLSTAYPVLRGSSEVSYEFVLELENRVGSETLFDLFAQGPEGWEVNFKPMYEPRLISSFQLKARETRKLAVEVRPPPGTNAGEYPVRVRISSGPASAEATLTVVITGTYDLSVDTVSGSLSLGAVQGKPSRFAILVKNTGTAMQSHIALFAFNPENWVVQFMPEKIDNLAPGQTAQVEVTMVPYDKALVGDYSVELRANGDKVSKPIELRITVNAPTLFGWIGMAIIVLVVFGLAVLFRWLGRR